GSTLFPYTTLFRSDGHLVFGSVREVDEFLGMSERECSTRLGMARVGGRGCVPTAQRLRHRRVTDRPGPPAVADRLELAIPSGGRQPYFDLYVRVARGSQRRGDTTERRQCCQKSAGRGGR